MALTLAEAREVVKTNCAATVDPVLGDGEVEALLTAGVRGVAWVANTVYAYNTILAPTVRTGHRYRVISGGTSGATEPSWPISAFSSISTGTVVVQEAGPDSSELYDVRRATYEAFRLKLAKAHGGYFNVSTPGGSLSLQQVVDNIERNMRRWQPVGLA